MTRPTIHSALALMIILGCPSRQVHGQKVVEQETVEQEAIIQTLKELASD